MSKKYNFDNRLDRRGKPTRASNYETAHLKVPCACGAPIKHKGPQLHTVTVVFDRPAMSIKTVRAQCAATAGFDVIADLSPDLPTCVRFAKALLTAATEGGTKEFQILDEHSDEKRIDTDGDLKVTSTLTSLVCASNLANNLRNSWDRLRDLRITEKESKKPAAVALKPRLLQNSFTAFVSKSMPFIDDCAAGTCPHTYPVINNNYLEFTVSIAYDGSLRLCTNGGIVATQRVGQTTWVADDDRVLSYVGSRIHPCAYPGNVSYKRINKQSVEAKSVYCFFCKQSFEKIDKHLEGAKHLTAVKNWFSLFLKAHSSAGLKMLNNQKYKHIFFPNLVK